MEILILLIALSLLIALGFLGAFIWATRSGQYDDDQTPAIRMLHDNPTKKAKTE
ncbi:MAG: cbb3-type cytochrome oxidase assembly protein CcoS [Saprospiraceae bacterium]|nr:cbb3-type cytochrome oxidase assembly protein CcoS [Saprospiraceae bacterium]